MGLTLDEAIIHAEEVAEEQENLFRVCPASESEFYHCDGTKDCTTLKNGKGKGCLKCAAEHKQLAEWLKELKQLRELARWTPVSKGLPKENETVIASTKYSVYPETRYTENGWEWAYESGADYWEYLEDVAAWMPLPERYKTESEEKK